METKYTKSLSKNEDYVGTRLYDFLWVINHYNWIDSNGIIFDVFIDDKTKSKKISIADLQKKYSNYQLFDYDLWEENIDEEYKLIGWLEIGNIKEVL